MMQQRSQSPLLMRKAPKLFKQNAVKMRKQSRGLDDLQAW